MRKIIVSEFMSLDGVMENPAWTFPFASPEQDAFKFKELQEAGALLLGRVTYEGFAQAWPNMLAETGEYGQWMNDYPKHVVSTTLENPEWNNSSVIQGDLAEEIAKLKDQPGRDLLVFGSATLVQSLLKLNLVDEYRLMTYPVVVGTGKRLFEEGLPNTSLKLAGSETFSSGTIVLTYVPA
ncbi:dihydrofolate reductase family protein [Paenibacillus sp. GCM10023252]|uniref:dihydrofolate reductase family protein n=1 Tax=Paenibacillus sp. GCM10023252 TaxID=3252649 RepID=UPI00361F94D1